MATWKEQLSPARMQWLVSFILLGNIAVFAYLLPQLFTVPTPSPLANVCRRRQPERLTPPGGLTVISVSVYQLA